MSQTRSKLLHSRLDRLSRLLTGVEEGNVRALHGARVASRRLRELLPVLQLDPDVTRKHAKRMRAVTRRLGAVRELDVLLLLIDELHSGRRARSHALGRVGSTISRERHDARKRLADRLPLSAIRRIVRKLGRVAENLAETEERAGRMAQRQWLWALEARVANRADALGSVLGKAGAVYLSGRLHDVRIALKKLRYALELFADATGDTASKDVGLLKRAQDILGRMHDVEMLIERVRHSEASLAPPNVHAWRDLDVLVRSLEDECRRLHARFMRTRTAIAALTDKLSARGARRAGAVARRAS
jgi:CHAD domain-containing protein